MRVQTAPGVWLDIGPGRQTGSRARGDMVALHETRPMPNTAKTKKWREEQRAKAVQT